MNADIEKPALELWGKSQGLEHPYPLAGHLIDTAAAARVICERMIPEGMIDALTRHMTGGGSDIWTNATVTLAGWHDIGKATCGFQARVPHARPAWLEGHDDTGKRHDIAGGNLVWDRLRNHPDPMTAAQIVGGHHGSVPRLSQRMLMAYGGAGRIDHMPPAALLAARKSLLDMIENSAGQYPDEVEMEPLAASASLAVVVLADWIVSQDWLIRAQQQAHGLDESDTWHSFDPTAHYRTALNLANTALAETGLLPPPQSLRKPEPADLIRNETADKNPEWRALQASIDAGLNPTGPGISVICAPTGEGKTEAALIAAAKYGKATGRHGFYFGMPTTATADGLYNRLTRYVSRITGDSGIAVRRVHSQAQLHDSHGGVFVSDDERAAANWMAGTRKAILAPWGVGTIDQVLLGAMRVKHSPLRLFGAAKGTVVIDEAHALDPYMRELLVRAVEWLAAYGASVVVLSATLPPKRVSELICAYKRGAGQGQFHCTGDNEQRTVGYPGWLAWSADDGYTNQAVEPRREWALTITRSDMPSSDLTARAAAAAVSASANGGCILLVRSTVRAAQDTYNAIRSNDSGLIPGDHLEILHSRMPMSVRRDRTESLMRKLGPRGRDAEPRPARFILVATQIVEQSLDVDFDALITDPAPAAQLLQRAGRVHRHDEVVRPDGMLAPQAAVMWPLGRDGRPSVSSPIYPTADLQAARQWLENEQTVVAVPVDIPGIVAGCDIETRFDDPGAYDADDIEIAEATLARIVAIDVARGAAHDWRIPSPHDAYLAELTSPTDDEDAVCPGTRQGAHSVMLVPALKAGGEWRLHDGTPIPHKGPRPDRATLLAVFGAAIPVSYPAGWADALDEIGPAWRGTPLAHALMLPDAGDGATVVDSDGATWRLGADPETGLRIERTRS